MENKTEYLSLYDFLGKPAGAQLGKEVWEAASKQGIKAGDVNTKKIEKIH
jgi:hypothetical protein